MAQRTFYKANAYGNRPFCRINAMRCPALHLFGANPEKYQISALTLVLYQHLFLAWPLLRPCLLPYGMAEIVGTYGGPPPRSSCWVTD